MHFQIVLFLFSDKMTRCPVLAKEYDIITIANMNSLQLSTYDRQPGTRVQISCLSNTFKVLGPTSLTCLRNGMWDKPFPKCVSRKEYIASQMKPNTTVSPVKPIEGAAQGKAGSKAFTIVVDWIRKNVFAIFVNFNYFNISPKQNCSCLPKTYDHTI